MITAVDSSVLLDVITNASAHADACQAALQHCSQEGGLILCDCVLAEISPALSGHDVIEFLDDWQLGFIPSSRESGLMAGELFSLYLQRGGKGGRIVVDFLIGAHAACHADRLLARDRGFLRDYFSDLKVLQP